MQWRSTRSKLPRNEIADGTEETEWITTEIAELTERLLFSASSADSVVKLSVTSVSH